MKTTLYTVLCVTVRLGAVLLAIGALERLPDVFIYGDHDGQHAVSAMLLEGAIVLVALALWLWPRILVWWAIGNNRHEILESPISARQIHYLAFSVTGVWLFITSLGGLAGHAVTILIILRRLSYDGGSSSVPDAEWHWVVQYTWMTLAGLGLALGARGVVGLFYRLRGYPMPQAATETDAAAGVDD